MQEHISDSVFYALLAGVDRCGVYISELEWQNIADILGYEIYPKAPESMMREIIEYAESNQKNDELKTLLYKLFERRVDEYENIKLYFPAAPSSYLSAAKLSLSVLKTNAI